MLPIMTIKKIAEKLKCSTCTIRIYLSRSEFSHLQWMKIKRTDIIKGLTDKDLKRLKQLLKRKRACI